MKHDLTRTKQRLQKFLLRHWYIYHDTVAKTVIYLSLYPEVSILYYWIVRYFFYKRVSQHISIKNMKTSFFAFRCILTYNETIIRYKKSGYQRYL